MSITEQSILTQDFPILLLQQGEDETVYDFKLREDVTFSDGEPLTADDLIFTLLCTILILIMMEMQHLYSTNIKGMKNYRLNSTAADSITDEDVANTLSRHAG